MNTHSPRRLQDPYPRRWVLLVSSTPPDRLIVFVHGFKGSALASWQHFPESAAEGAWWQASDMLFVGYDSLKDTITGVASRLRRELPRFYPSPPPELLAVDGARARPAPDEPYRELLLVGHSLGGVVVRRALSDVAHGWKGELEVDQGTPRPELLDAEVRLFSPASAGFRAAGWLGMIRASSVWGAANLHLRRSSTFTDLQPDSPLLATTQRRTEQLVAEDSQAFAALRASILWANPDNVVLSERYDSDLIDDTADETTHRSVCKPRAAYRDPWKFVETGRRS